MSEREMQQMSAGGFHPGMLPVIVCLLERPLAVIVTCAAQPRHLWLILSVELFNVITCAYQFLS